MFMVTTDCAKCGLKVLQAAAIGKGSYQPPCQFIRQPDKQGTCAVPADDFKQGLRMLRLGVVLPEISAFRVGQGAQVYLLRGYVGGESGKDGPNVLFVRMFCQYPR